MFFRDLGAKGQQYAELYELVQHAGNVLPRLYLLCTGGLCVSWWGGVVHVGVWLACACQIPVHRLLGHAGGGAGCTSG